MRVLALDTALAVCAVAVFDTELDRIVAGESLPMERGHAEALMPMVARVMDSAGLEFSEIDRVAVTVGPGSFTGLRVGIAAARGIALAAAKSAVGVSTLAAFAAPCIAEDLAEATLAMVDARHGHVYAQVFGAGGRTLHPAAYMTVAEAISAAEGAVHVAGSGIEVLRAQWPENRLPPIGVRSAPSPDIVWVARLCAAANAQYAPAKPLYLREPDARPQDAARLARQ